MAKVYLVLHKPKSNSENNMVQNIFYTKCNKFKIVSDVLHYNQQKIISTPNASEFFDNFFQKITAVITIIQTSSHIDFPAIMYLKFHTLKKYVNST